MTKTVWIKPEYECWPLWWDGGGNIDPRTLPLQENTVQALIKWSDIHEATYNADDPVSSGFESEEQSLQFDQHGLQLWKKVQVELQNLYEVGYWRQDGVVLKPDA